MRGFFLAILMWLAVARCSAQTPPPNDYFTNRIALTGPVAVFGGDISLATWPEFDSQWHLEPCPSSGGGCRDATLWWSYTAQDSTPIIVESVEGERWEPSALAVYPEATFPEMYFNEVAVFDLTRRGQYAVFQPVPGKQYQIQFAGMSPEIYGIPRHTTLFRLTVTNAPMMRLQPQTQTVTEGASTIFTAFAIGVKPLYYQWKRDGVDIPDATNMMVSLENVTTDDAAGYSVVITNSTGSVTSRVAQLYVTTNDSPAVLKALGMAGKGFRFSVTGEEGRKYRVEFSENLTNWDGPVIMNTNLATSFAFTNPAAKGFLRLATYHAENEVCINRMRQISTAIWLSAEDGHFLTVGPVDPPNA